MHRSKMKLMEIVANEKIVSRRINELTNKIVAYYFDNPNNWGYIKGTIGGINLTLDGSFAVHYAGLEEYIYPRFRVIVGDNNKKPFSPDFKSEIELVRWFKNRKLDYSLIRTRKKELLHRTFKKYAEIFVYSLLEQSYKEKKINFRI